MTLDLDHDSYLAHDSYHHHDFYLGHNNHHDSSLAALLLDPTRDPEAGAEDPVQGEGSMDRHHPLHLPSMLPGKTEKTTMTSTPIVMIIIAIAISFISLYD